MLARQKSDDMKVNNYFDHQSPTTGTPWNMMSMFDLGSGTAAENIAMGYGSGEAVFNGWKNSKGHYANMIGGYTHIGIGKSPGTYFWTQNFGVYRAQVRIQLTNSHGKALKQQKTIVIGDPETFGSN